METYSRQDYLFDLPEERIAQRPSEARDLSRLLTATRDGKPDHGQFRDIVQFMKPGDVLVLNQTRVMNARCFALKENGTRIEIFILGIQVDPKEVPAMARPAKRLKVGTRLHFTKADVWAEVREKGEMGKATLAFENLDQLLSAVANDGSLPLPPYIKRAEGPDQDDIDRYQTIFARDLGAVAAPTAGLHFTQPLLEQLQALGVELAFVTHHVGIGTFKPLTAEDIRDHEMEAESYIMPLETAERLNLARAEGRRIIAVGTTSTRCLESNFDGGFHAGTYTTRHYIYPGYRFKAIDALVTNFHLPGSSLILLVCALMGRERMLDLYREALTMDYRFYSYGDAMFLIP